MKSPAIVACLFVLPLTGCSSEQAKEPGSASSTASASVAPSAVGPALSPPAVSVPGANPTVTPSSPSGATGAGGTGAGASGASGPAATGSGETGAGASGPAGLGQGPQVMYQGGRGRAMITAVWTRGTGMRDLMNLDQRGRAGRQTPT